MLPSSKNYQSDLADLSLLDKYTVYIHRQSSHLEASLRYKWKALRNDNSRQMRQKDKFLSIKDLHKALGSTSEVAASFSNIIFF